MSPTSASVEPSRPKAFALAMLFAGMACTLLMPYPLLSVIVFTSLRGHPTKLPLAALCGAALLTAALTLCASRRQLAIRTCRQIAIALPLLWLASAVVTGALWIDPTLVDPKTMGLMFGLCSLGLPALLWFPVLRRAQLRGLGLLLGALLVGGPLLYAKTVRHEGVGGDADRFALMWRTRSTPHASIQPPPEQEAVQHRSFPQFLGEHRNATVPEVHLVDDWAKSPPQLLWRQPIGAGLGAFAVERQYAVTQEQVGEEEAVSCYELTTGKLLWQHLSPGHFYHGLARSGPRATPTIDRGRVYALGALGLLRCLDLKTGSLHWAVETAGGTPTHIAYGVSSSPLIVDEMVVVGSDLAADRSIAAFRIADGSLIWTSGTAGAGYSSPILADLAGVRQIVYYDARNVMGLVPGEGRILWTYPWTNEQANCSQPVINAGGKDQVLVSTGYGKGSVLLKISQDAAGFKVEELWTSTFMRNKFSTSVAVGSAAFGLDDGILSGISLVDGKRLWKSGRYGHGQVLLVGERLLVQAENGDLLLVEVGVRKATELGKITGALNGKCWNYPAFPAPYLLLRNDTEAVCYRVNCRDESASDPGPSDASRPTTQ